jgi:Zn-dependent M28 family amino/carboxypeptidase
MMQTGYSQKPEFKNISYVINFDAPPKYNQYKENGSTIEYDNGAILSLIQPKTESELLELYQRKMMKAFSRSDILKCIPILW